MPKEIWLGPVLGTQRERLLARCAEYVSRGETERIVYIAASHPLLDLATQTILDGKNARGVWGEFPFYLFRGFVRRVLSSATASPGNDAPSLTLGFLPRVPIDREELPLRHSLISQIIKQLAEAGRLPATRRLANRDGCVSTVASLIGELQRAGTSAEQFKTIIESRNAEDQSPKAKALSPKSQADFDRDVALIYAKYSEGLDRFELTDEDADQLRALQILRGDVGQVVNLPANRTTQVNNLRYEASWLDNVELLVLDGFFDFTPVQGEMLRLLIPRIPNVIVNVNPDPSNEPLFKPFQSTIEQLKSIAKFEIRQSGSSDATDGSLSLLPSRLFNAEENLNAPTARKMPATPPQDVGAPVAILRECSDRETELRWIAKEVKRLVFANDYKI